MPDLPSPLSAPSTDPLAEALHLLRLSGTLYCQSELSAPWSIEMPPLEGCMMFHIVTAGQCTLQVGDEPPVLLKQGGMALVPHGQGHLTASNLDIPSIPLFDLPIQKVSERFEILQHGGDGTPTQLLCGVVRFDHVAAAQLIRQLPSILAVDSWEDESERWLRSTMHFLAREAKTLRPGSETVMTRLADILVVQMIRSWIARESAQEQGWLAALQDPQIGLALQAMQRAPEKPWTLVSLAKTASMSRAAFAAKFTTLLSEPPMQYLTRWRMQMAHDKLHIGRETLASIAIQCGYQSEAAFSRAFKRIYGEAPGTLRKRLARPQTGAL